MPTAPPIELWLNALWYDTDPAAPAAAAGPLAPTALKWLVTNPVADRRHLAPPPPADLTKWYDPQVGWGVILPEKPGTAADAPEDPADVPAPLRDLIADRAAKTGKPVPVFRYDKAWPYRYSLLRSRDRGKAYAISATPHGLADDCVPYFLLICGSPADIPWEFQYVLNATHAVGRLDLDDVGLARYAAALVAGWPAAGGRPTADPAKAVVWAVDHSAADITHMMKEVIADPLYAKYSTDTDMKSWLLAGDGAGGGALVAALAANRPGLVVTTSHGKTAPTAAGMEAEMRADLGVPVDRDYRPLDRTKLLEKWDPYGAVWYAHACCSAGADGLNRFDGMVAPASSAKTVLDAVARLGAVSAPLPRALLGGERPVRAFVGHVEPTFDWTLRHPDTKQTLTGWLVKALYDNLYNHYPIGHAFREWFRQLGGLHDSYAREMKLISQQPTVLGPLLYAALAAKDVESTVLLGDPTATL